MTNEKVPMPTSIKVVIGILIFFSVAVLSSILFGITGESIGRFTGKIIPAGIGLFLGFQFLKWRKNKKKK